MRKRTALITTTIVLAFVIFLTINKVKAATYYVAGDVGDDSHTTTEAKDPLTPWKTIQKAATTMTLGDIVNVKGGITYNEKVTPANTGGAVKNITYQAWEGTGIPILELTGQYAGFYISNKSYININGFEIKHTTATSGGNSYGIYITTTTGSSGNIKITNCIIHDINEGVGRSIYISSSKDITIQNTILADSYYGFYMSSGTATLENNIIYSNSYGISASRGSYVNLQIDYNDVYANTTWNFALGLLPRGGHDLSLNPQFEDFENNDFRLKSNSPLVDAGKAISEITKDAIGTARPQGNAYDIGPLESVYSQSDPPNIIANPNYTAPSNIMTLIATFTGEEQDDRFADPDLYQSLDMADLDHDGYDDVIVGAKYHTPGGGVYIFKGSENIQDTDASEASIILRDSSGATALGFTVNATDINNNGDYDLLVSNYRYPHPEDNAGALYLIPITKNTSSQDISTAQAGKLIGSYYRNGFGAPANGIGDVNGDGYNDYLVGDSGDNVIYLFYGKDGYPNGTGSELSDVTYDLESVCGDPFVNAEGDINGDGYNDIFIGCPYHDDFEGDTYIFFGSQNLSSKTVSQADAIITGDFSGDNFTIADMNSDGYDDIIEINTTIEIYYGSANFGNKTYPSSDASIIADSSMLDCQSSIGNVISTADINNDGFLDLIAGNPYLPRTFIFYGSANWTDRTAASADLVFDGLWGSRPSDSVAVGDIDGDNYVDIASGASLYDSRRGRVQVLTAPHSKANIEIDSMKKVHSIEVKGSASFESHNIGGIEIRVDDDDWINCTADDGAFNEINENFTCYLSDEVLGDNPQQISIRMYNEFGVYVPADEYLVNEIPDYLLLAGTGDNYEFLIFNLTILNTAIFVIIIKIKDSRRYS